jgi:type II secretory ATPase GspE/PulE/Tfp pilus assembly ATPase PilB-like protein
MKEISQLQVVDTVQRILTEAVGHSASDVHFEPTAKNLQVRFRLDGTLNTVEKLPRTIADNVIARLKVLANLLTYRNDIPQEGRIERFVPSAECTQTGHVTDMRLAVFPTIHGQRAVVRLFYDQQNLIDLDMLGLSDYALSAITGFAKKHQGVLLVTGPAGSGKSTTLAALLRYILCQSPGKSIISLEDPVERGIEGVTQIQIEPHGQLTFPVALRSLLRQDPEVLMVGEIRDSQTAAIVIHAGLTGHLLMSTLHSGSCSAALLRLLEMGIEPYQLTSAISAVIHQRLVRRLCPACKKQGACGYFEPVGCGECYQTGFQGRLLLSEAIELDGLLRQALLERPDVDKLDGILSQRGMMNLVQHGRLLASRGLTCQSEIDRVCGTES